MSSTAAAGDVLAINGAAPVTDSPVPFMSLGLTEQDIDAAVEVLRSGMLRAASKCAEFEKQFAAASDAKHAMTCSNGTVALQLAYGATLERGDEVIAPAWTYIATVTMLVAAGCNVTFCDVDPKTYQIDVADVEKRITPKTKAIACTHLYGMPVDIDAVQAVAKKHNLAVIYDAAQAHLATYKGKGIGAFGDVVTYSFYATKNLGTGEGGMVTCNDDDLARKIALLRSHGETDKYLHESVGFNYRLNDIAGAIGLSKLQTLPDLTAKRRVAADRYTQLLEQFEAIAAPTRTDGADSAWHLFTCRLDLDKVSCTRDEFCDALRAEGVPTAVHYPLPLTRQPALKHLAKEPLPVSEALAASVFCLPMHHELSDEHFGVIEQAISKVLSVYAV